MLWEENFLAILFANSDIILYRAAFVQLRNVLSLSKSAIRLKKFKHARINREMLQYRYR